MPKTEWDDMLLIYAFLAGWREQSKPWWFISMRKESWDAFIEEGHPLDKAYEKGKFMASVVNTVPTDPAKVELSQKEYVFGKLPENLQKYWDELEALGKGNQRAVAKFIDDRGEGFRKAVLIHSYAETYNLNLAMKKAGCSRHVLEKWLAGDKNFNALWHEIFFYKKNDLETALMDKVKEKDTQAILFANKTLNYDRGYADVSKVEHTHSHESNQQTLDLTTLNLPPDVQQQIVKAIALKQRNDQIESEMKAIEARNVR